MTKRKFMNSFVKLVLIELIHLTSHDLLLLDFKNFQILMIGRLLGGVATSLLFSVFEAWLIGAHANAGVMVRLLLSVELVVWYVLIRSNTISSHSFQ